MSRYRPSYLKALDALRKREGLFRVLMFSLVTVLFWIGFTIYFSQQKTKIPPEVQRYALPLNPTIDAAALTQIGQLRAFSPQELADFPIYDSVIDEEGFVQIRVIGSDLQIGTESATPITTDTTATSAAEL